MVAMEPTVSEVSWVSKVSKRTVDPNDFNKLLDDLLHSFTFNNVTVFSLALSWILSMVFVDVRLTD